METSRSEEAMKRELLRARHGSSAPRRGDRAPRKPGRGSAPSAHRAGGWSTRCSRARPGQVPPETSVERRHAGTPGPADRVLALALRHRRTADQRRRQARWATRAPDLPLITQDGTGIPRRGRRRQRPGRCPRMPRRRTGLDCAAALAVFDGTPEIRQPGGRSDPGENSGSAVGLS